jgi:hypothetical protein
LLLHALAGIGIFAETDEHTFCHTDRSRSLQSHTTASIVKLWSAPYQWQAWSCLSHTIRTGQPALEASSGDANIWDYLTDHPQEMTIFQHGLTAVSNLVIPALFGAYDFSMFKQVVDIGGGHGNLIVSLLTHYPQLSGTLFDRPSVVEQARLHMRERLSQEILSRYLFAGGDFLQAIPSRGDCLILKNVLMDWSDDDYRRLLQNCRQSLVTPSGRVLIIESVQQGAETPFTGFFTLQMAMMMKAARHRTIEEHRVLLQAAGFSLTLVIPLGMEQMLLEAQIIQ